VGEPRCHGIAPDDIAMVRMLAMVLLPQLAGLVLMFAIAVARPR